MTVLVTGASGFVGRHLVNELRHRGYELREARRGNTVTSGRSEGISLPLTGSGALPEHWMSVMAGSSQVVHLAARAHVLNETTDDPAHAFHVANVQLTRACAEAAALSGIKRFVFVSTVGVHGNCSGPAPFRIDSPIMPRTHYARSKAEAERSLTEVAARTGLEVVVVRPPLVYGRDAPGNFNALMRAVASGFPMPLGSIRRNRRSLAAIDNLVDLLITCLEHEAAANQTFLVSDGEDLSTADLLRRMGDAMGCPARLFPVPAALLELGARCIGRRDMAERLLASLQVDITHTRHVLGWTPPISVDEGLRRSAARMCEA